MSESVGEALVGQLARCRELLVEYRSLPKGAGAFGAIIIDDAVNRAEAALASDDVLAILRSYEELKGLN